MHFTSSLNGLCGYLPRNDNLLPDDTIERMLKPMLHEPWYSSGIYRDQSLGIALGWTSQFGATSDSIPIWSKSNHCALLLCGEVASITTTISSASAASVLELFERNGSAVFPQINGWFAGIFIDHRSKVCTLFNDRFGIRRIYYHEAPSGVYFSTEAKSLLSTLPHLRQLDAVSLGEFLTCGCPLNNRTLFSGVALLPGATEWCLSPGKADKRVLYFSPKTWEQQDEMEPESYYRDLLETFTRVLPRYLRSDGPKIGVSLTGGVDSRMIMAWARCPPGALPCYSFSGPIRECRDVTLARQLAHIASQPHHTIPLGPEFLSRFPTLFEKAAFISDGTMDPSGAVELYVNNQARQIAPIRLTGNYGGEVLRSSVGFGPRRICSLPYNDDLTGYIAKARITYAEQRNCRDLSFVVFKQVPWFHCARLSVEQSQITVRSPFLDNELVECAFRAPLSLRVVRQTCLRLIMEGAPELARMPTDRGLIAGADHLPDRLRHLWNELTFKAEYAFDYGMPQFLAPVVNLLSLIHPERFFLGRHKFYHFRHWYSHQLAAFVREYLLDKRTYDRPFFCAAGIQQIVNEHTSGRRNYTTELHRILTLESMQRLFID